MQLQMDELSGRAAAVELVERKGLGHPDTICDALAEQLSRELSRYYLERFGRVLHHNVDKALLCAGASRPAFSGGEVLEPLEIHLAGRATSSVRGQAIPVGEIAVESTKRWLAENLPRLDLERHVRIHCRLHPGSADLTQLFERAGAPPANDSSFGVGYAPLSELEQLVLAAESRLNSQDFRRAHPEAGSDVKITALRSGSEISLTLARAFIGAELGGLSDYLAAKAATASCIEQVCRERGLSAEVLVNAADDPDRGAVYITVLGTSAECGDDGQVGRGNRANGLITPHRPMSMEALAGKNPITHVGKLYNVLAREIAEDLVGSLAEVAAARCYLMSQIGRPIDDPRLVHLEIQTRSGSGVEALREPAAQIVRQHLGQLARLSQRIVRGEVQLF